MSELSDKIYQLLGEAFPLLSVKQEHYVLYRNQRLFFDFYIPDLKLCIEVQGDQHYKYVPFFHSSLDKFRQNKYRDELKTQWCAENNISLIEINKKHKQLTKTTIRNKILKVIRDRNNGS